MNDVCTYCIELRGEVDEAEINVLSPLWVAVERCGADAMLLTVSCDQSGLIGLLRYLHGLGFVFLALGRVDGV